MRSLSINLAYNTNLLPRQTETSAERLINATSKNGMSLSSARAKVDLQLGEARNTNTGATRVFHWLASLISGPVFLLRDSRAGKMAIYRRSVARASARRIMG